MLLPELNLGGAALSQVGIKHGGQQEALSGDSLFDSLFYSSCFSPAPPQISECELVDRIQLISIQEVAGRRLPGAAFPGGGGDVTGCRLSSVPLLHPTIEKETNC